MLILRGIDLRALESGLPARRASGPRPTAGTTILPETAPSLPWTGSPPSPAEPGSTRTFGLLRSRRRRRSGGPASPRHLQAPGMKAGLVPNRNLHFLGNEPHHLNLNLPDPRGKIKRISAVLVRVGHHFGRALAGRNFRTGNWLVGGADRSALLRRSEQDGKEGWNQRDKK